MWCNSCLSRTAGIGKPQYADKSNCAHLPMAQRGVYFCNPHVNRCSKTHPSVYNACGGGSVRTETVQDDRAVNNDDRPFATGRKLGDLKHLSLCFFGFAFIRAWDDMAFYRFSALVPGQAWIGQDLFLLAMIAVFAPLAVFARKVAPLYEKPWSMPTATAALIASTVLWVASGVGGDAGFALMIASIVCAGAGASLSILMWAELQSCFNPFRVVIYVSGAFFLGAIMGWLFVGMGLERLSFVLVVLPLLSLVCLKIGFAKIPKADLPKRTWGKMRFPWGLIVVLGIYQFIFGFHAADDISMVSPSVWGTIIAAGALFLATYLLSHRFDFTFIYRTPFVLMTCGLLITLLAFSKSNVVGSLFISTAYTSMFLVITILLCDISHRYGISVLVLCGIQEVATVTVVGGDLLESSMNAGLLPVRADDTIVIVVLTILVVIATVALLFERKASEEWGLAFFGADKIAEDGDEASRFALRCAEIADRYRLSPREKEVFWLLTSEKTLPEIAKELYIATGTLKSHTRRIYQKLDVHSRQEMMDLIEVEAYDGAVDGSKKPAGKSDAAQV